MKNSNCQQVLTGSFTRAHAKSLANWRAGWFSRAALRLGGPAFAFVTLLAIAALAKWATSPPGALEFFGLAVAVVVAIPLYVAGHLLWKACFRRLGAAAGLLYCERAIELEIAVSNDGIEFKGARGTQSSHLTATEFESRPSGIFIDCATQGSRRTPGKNTLFVPRSWIASSDEPALIDRLRLLGAMERSKQFPAARLVEPEGPKGPHRG